MQTLEEPTIMCTLLGLLPNDGTSGGVFSLLGGFTRCGDGERDRACGGVSLRLLRGERETEEEVDSRVVLPFAPDRFL